MAKDTFNSYIEKNKKKYLNKQEQINQQLQENEQLASILDEMAVNGEKYETGSYSKQEVAEAAKSMLKAQPYDVDITHMDLTDNAVYYNTQTQKSRGRFSRKNVRDYGKMMIDKAKEIREERRLAAEEEARQQKLREEQAAREAFVQSTLDGMSLQTEDLSIPEQWQREADYAEKEAGYYSSGMFDKFTKIPVYSKNMKAAFQGEMGSAIQERIKNTLSKDIPTFDSIVAQFNQKMQSGLKNFAKDSKKTEQDIAKKKTDLMESYSEKLKVLESRYRDVKEGRVSPEAFKLFMDTALFTYKDTAQQDIYSSFVSDDSVKLTSEEVEKKNQAENKLKKEFDQAEREEERDFKEKGDDHRGAWKKKFFEKHPYKASVDKIANMYPNVLSQNLRRAIHQRKAFLESGFVFFTGEKYSHNCKKRYYVTCKKEKHKEMLDAWATVLEKNKELSQRIKFKFGGEEMKDRKDNIVIYVPEAVKEKDMMKLMKDMSDECSGKEILAEGKESLETAGKVFDGITKAPEFPVNVAIQKILDSGLCDQKESSEFYSKMKDLAQKENKTVIGDGNPPIAQFSYNGYLAKAAFLAESIVRQKHGIGPDGSIDDEGMMKEVRTYFNDFIRLSGVDPATFEHLS